MAHLSSSAERIPTHDDVGVMDDMDSVAPFEGDGEECGEVDDCITAFHCGED
jgi:hypothetical protein